MRVLIRADASAQIGGGHVWRCLALAAGLRRQGASVGFACRALPGDMRVQLAKRGFEVVTVQETPDVAADARAALTGQKWDWAVVDHYGLGERWERTAQALGARVMALDDRPLRRHVADLLLDPNLSKLGAARWDGWRALHTRVLAGARFLLLREDFFVARAGLRPRDGVIRRIVVSMGAADVPGAACTAVRGLLQLAGEGALCQVEVVVVAGAGNPHASRLEALARKLPQSVFLTHTDDMAALLAAADLALGAGGGSVWERAYLAVPSCVVTLADNQRDVVDLMAQAGALVPLGWHEELQPAAVAAAVRALLAEPARAQHIGRCAQACVGEPDFVRSPMEWFS